MPSVFKNNIYEFGCLGYTLSVIHQLLKKTSRNADVLHKAENKIMDYSDDDWIERNKPIIPIYAHIIKYEILIYNSLIDKKFKFPP